MSKNRSLNDDERADLVAYLDGEMVGEAKRAIEAKISLDSTWRTEADSLRRAWDMLDFLPKAEPTPSFTERTLSRIEPIRKPVRTKKTHPDRAGWRSTTGWLLGGWAAALLLMALG